jgi:hypothetical protein
MAIGRLITDLEKFAVWMDLNSEYVAPVKLFVFLCGRATTFMFESRRGKIRDRDLSN